MRNGKLKKLISLTLASVTAASLLLTGCGEKKNDAIEKSVAQGYYNVRDFGAVGDGKTDDTKAVQKAIDAAAADSAKKASDWGKGEVYQADEVAATVLVPSGIYMVHDLNLKPCVTIKGGDGWGFSTAGNSILRLNSKSAKYMFNMTESYGACLDGLSLEGMDLGKNVHGVMVKNNERTGDRDKDAQKVEDSIKINRCRISNFSGDGVHLDKCWVFRIIDSQIHRNGGNGAFLNAWDGQIMNTWFSSNKGWGVYTDEKGYNNSAVIMTGNRYEWNRKGGALITAARKWQICNNYFDHNFGPGLRLASNGSQRLMNSFAISVVSNGFNRNGYTEDSSDENIQVDDLDQCQIRMEDVFNVTVTSNTFTAGANDNYTGAVCPKYGIVYGKLSQCVISDNAMEQGFTAEKFHDLGDNGDEVIFENNVGDATSEVNTIQVPGMNSSLFLIQKDGVDIMPDNH